VLISFSHYIHLYSWFYYFSFIIFVVALSYAVLKYYSYYTHSVPSYTVFTVLSTVRHYVAVLTFALWGIVLTLSNRGLVHMTAVSVHCSAV
jgi:hypothetical protein